MTASPAPGRSAATTGSRTCGARAAPPGRSAWSRTGVRSCSWAIRSPRAGEADSARRSPESRFATAASTATPRGGSHPPAGGRARPRSRRRRPAHRNERSRGRRDARDHRGQPQAHSGRVGAARAASPDRALPGVPERREQEAAVGPDQGGQRALSGRGEERRARDPGGDVAALRGCRGRRDRGRVPGPAASERSGLREVGGGAASRAGDSRLRRGRGRSVHAGARLREPVQRTRPHGLGVSADVGSGPGGREAVAGVGSQCRGMAVRDGGGALRRPGRDPGRPLSRDRGTSGRDHAALVSPDPAALDDARVPAGLRAEAGVPGDAERGQRPLCPWPAAPGAATT